MTGKTGIKAAERASIIITGDIKSIEDYQKIKETMRELLDYREAVETIAIDIPDAASMTSSVIGFFLKLVYEDKINISLRVKKERLYELLKTLNLADVFNAKKI